MADSESWDERLRRAARAASSYTGTESLADVVDPKIPPKEEWAGIKEKRQKTAQTSVPGTTTEINHPDVPDEEPDEPGGLAGDARSSEHATELHYRLMHKPRPTGQSYDILGEGYRTKLVGPGGSKWIGRAFDEIPDEMAGVVNERAELEEQKASQLADSHMEARAVATNTASELAHLAEKQAFEQEARLNEKWAELEKLKNEKIDTGRLWQDPVNVIGAAAAAIGMGFGSTDPQAGFRIIDAAVKRDIDAQVHSIGLRENTITKQVGLVHDLMKVYGDQRIAKTAAYALYTDAAKNHVTEIGQRFRSKDSKLAAQQLVKQLEQQSIMSKMGLYQALYSAPQPIDPRIRQKGMAPDSIAPVDPEGQRGQMFGRTVPGRPGKAFIDTPEAVRGEMLENPSMRPRKIPDTAAGPQQYGFQSAPPEAGGYATSREPVSEPRPGKAYQRDSLPGLIEEVLGTNSVPPIVRGIRNEEAAKMLEFNGDSGKWNKWVSEQVKEAQSVGRPWLQKELGTLPSQLKNLRATMAAIDAADPEWGKREWNTVLTALAGSEKEQRWMEIRKSLFNDRADSKKTNVEKRKLDLMIMLGSMRNDYLNVKSGAAINNNEAARLATAISTSASWDELQLQLKKFSAIVQATHKNIPVHSQIGKLYSWFIDDPRSMQSPGIRPALKSNQPKGK